MCNIQFELNKNGRLWKLGKLALSDRVVSFVTALY